jgi:hypothetical protein
MPVRKPGILCAMVQQIEILDIQKDGEDGILVKFSDGTITGYVVEELLRLRPVRERVEESTAPKPRLKAATQP